MKYLLVFLIILSFIAPSVQSDKSFSDVFKDGFYNYITCLDNSLNYLVETVPAFSNIAQVPYEKAYKKVMDDRHHITQLQELVLVVQLYVVY